MAFDQPKTSGKDIELRIPSPDKAGVFVPGIAISDVLEADVLADSGVSPAGEAAPASDVVPQETAPGKIIHAEAGSDATNQAGASAVKPVEIKPLAPTEPVKVKRTEKSPLLSPGKTAEKKAEKLPEQSDSATGYTVQVAAFANAETAAQQTEQLKAWGFKAYTEMVSGTTRVRVGPYADRTIAEEVRAHLLKHRLHPVIMTNK